MGPVDWQRADQRPVLLRLGIVAAVDVGLGQLFEIRGQAGRQRRHAAQHDLGKIRVDRHREVWRQRLQVIGPEHEHRLGAVAAFRPEVDAAGERVEQVTGLVAFGQRCTLVVRPRQPLFVFPDHQRRLARDDSQPILQRHFQVQLGEDGQIQTQQAANLTDERAGRVDERRRGNRLGAVDGGNLYGAHSPARTVDRLDAARDERARRGIAPAPA